MNLNSLRSLKHRLYLKLRKIALRWKFIPYRGSHIPESVAATLGEHIVSRRYKHRVFIGDIPKDNSNLNTVIEKLPYVTICIEGEARRPELAFEKWSKTPVLVLGNKLQSKGHYEFHQSLYVPFCSIVFAELKNRSPLELLHRKIHQKSKFCAYMYRRCYKNREAIFDYFLRRCRENDISHFDALGKCHGTSGTTITHDPTSRVRSSWASHAIDLYKPYKFVLAIENASPNIGYVTEKILLPFLAGSIPVYWGDAEVLEIFNPNSFIYLGNDEAPNLEEAFEKMIELHKNNKYYEEIVSQPVITSESLNKFFSWHRSLQHKDFTYIKDECDNFLSKWALHYNLKVNTDS